MSAFRTIEIDFDVHKKIESERTSFSDSANDELRRLLRIGAAKDQVSLELSRSWSDMGVVLPHGTQVRMSYNGRTHSGLICDGKWVVEGKEHSKPSPAASAVAVTKRGRKTQLDGWKYWEAKRPGDDDWQSIAELRPSRSEAADRLLAELDNSIVSPLATAPGKNGSNEN